MSLDPAISALEGTNRLLQAVHDALPAEGKGITVDALSVALARSGVTVDRERLWLTIRYLRSAGLAEEEYTGQPVDSRWRRMPGGGK